MAQRFRNPPIAGLRRLLLVLFVVGVATVVIVLVLRRRDDPLAERRTGGGTALDQPDDITLVGEGFEFTQSEGDRPIFHIRGESVKVRRAQLVMLDDVALTVYDEGGKAYRVDAREATYDQTSRDATLSGDLRMTGPDGMVLLADGMRLANEGKQAQTVGPVELFWGDELHATALRFIGRLAVNVFALAGQVEVSQLAAATAGEPATLRAASITFDRKIHNVRADQDVVLTRGGDRLEADLLSMFLSTDDRRLELLRARGLVRAHLPGATAGGGGPDGGQPAARTLRLAGEILTVHMDDAGREPIQVELSGGRGYQAELVAESPAGHEEVLRADFVVSSLLPEGGQRIQALGSPRLVERPSGGADAAAAGTTGAVETILREVSAGTLSARLAATGELSSVEAGGGVDFRSADVRARGDRLEYDAAGGKAELFGKPVRVVSDRGELTAPHVVEERSADPATGDLLWADGGTRSVLRREGAGGLGGSPFARGEGPLRIESESAFWRDGTALFRGGVRAWQGQSLLLASELRASQANDGAEALSASAPVRSVWVPTAATGPTTPIEVTAQGMEYSKPAGGAGGTLVYRGRVRSQQGELSLACGELTVELGPDGDAERMRCREAVRLEDRASGQTARGELALYDLAGRRIEITGSPVVLTHGDGGQVEGSRAVYELDRGRARVVGGGESAPGGPSPPSPAPGEGAP